MRISHARGQCDVFPRCLICPASRALPHEAEAAYSLIYGAQLEVLCYISSMYGADWTAERVVDCLTVALSRPIFAGAESERLPRKDLFVIWRMTDSNHVIRKKRGRPKDP